MTAGRSETVSFWVSVVWATFAATLLGFQLADTTLPVWTFVFAVVTSWMGLYLGLDHVFTVARRMKDGQR